MEEFFNTMYLYTNGLYGDLLDTYLYETTPGYLHIGLFLLISTFLVCAFFYYILAPVRKQTLWWFVFAGINLDFASKIAEDYNISLEDYIKYEKIDW